MKTVLRFILGAVLALPLAGQNTTLQKVPATPVTSNSNKLTDASKVFIVGDGGSITATGTGVIVATGGVATSIPWSGITSKPTTVSGFGITDAVTTARTISTTAPLTGGGALSANLTLAIPAATSSVNGYLTSANWTTFNAKESALTFSTPLARSTNTISIPAATSSVNGYLSSADWTTFNAKQTAGNYITALTGDATAAGPGSAALTLATVNTNVGAFGSGTQVATFTVNGKGLITAAGNTTVTPAWSSITGTPTTLAGYGITDGVNAKVDDTNVTGSITGHTLTLGWTGQLAVARGGTGAATLTGVLLGNGTSAFTAATLSNLTLSSGTLSISSSYAGQSSIVTVGTLTSGAIGSGFTAIPNSALANASVTIGTTAIALGASSTTITGLTTVTGPAGNLTIVAGSGNSRTLTMQTTTSGGTATNALVLNADQSASLPAGLLNGSSTALALAAGSATGGTVVPVGQTITTLVYEGDSLTAPVSEGRSNYYLTTNAFFSSATGYNVATGGDTAQNMVTEYESQGRIYRPANAGGGGVFFIWAGINDILSAGRTSSQVYNDLKTIWAKARADGYRVVAFTLTPSTGYSGATETTRLAVNTSIRADATLYDFLIQPDVLFPDATNTANYPDGQHLSTAASVTLGNNIDGIVTQPTTNSSAFAAGVVHAAGSTYNSLLQVSGNLGLNEDGNGASAIIRYGSTYSTTGALYFNNGPTSVLTLSRTVNTSSSPVAVTSTTNAFDAAGTSGSLSTLGGISVAKDIWSTGLTVTGTAAASGAFVLFGTGTGTSHAVLTLNRSGAGLNATIKGQTAGVTKWSWGMNNDGTTNWAVVNEVLGANALTISQTDSAATFAATIATTGLTSSGAVTVNITSAIDPLVLNRSSGTSNIYTIYNLSGSSKALIGIAGATNGLVTGSASGDICVRGNTQNFFVSTDGGTTAALKIATTTFVASFGSTTEATIAAAGAITSAGGIYATKAIVSGSATDATSITTGGIIGAGGLGITKAAWIGGLMNVAGVLTSANATDASNTTTAGTVVTGGLAVAKKSYIGDDVHGLGNLYADTAGKTLIVKSGSNAAAGTVTLVAGTATITSTAIDANTVIVFSEKTAGGVPGLYQPLAAVASGSAAVTSATTDTSTYNWVAVKVN